jgi:hypothetical protein
MNPSKLLPLLASLCFPLPACAGTVASTDDAPAPKAASATTPASASTADWSCTQAGASLPDWSHPAALGPQDTLAVHLVEAYSSSDVGRVTVLACNASDTTCASPLGGTQADDSGLATLTIPGAGGSFDGYLAITGDEMPPNLVFFDGRTSQAGSYEVIVYTAPALGITATLAGVTLDARFGVLQVEAHDCVGAPAAGITLGLSTSDRATEIAYFTGGGGALMPNASGTDETGVAIAFGVHASGFGVREALGATAVGGAIAFARPGAVSSVVALP